MRVGAKVIELTAASAIWVASHRTKRIRDWLQRPFSCPVLMAASALVYGATLRPLCC